MCSNNYMNEEGRSQEQNWPRPLGLRPKVIPGLVARRSFGSTKLRFSRLAWGHLGRQREGVMDSHRPFAC